MAVTVAMTKTRLASTLRTGVALAPRPGCSAKRVPMTAGEPSREWATISAAREMCWRGSVAPTAPGSDHSATKDHVALITNACLLLDDGAILLYWRTFTGQSGFRYPQGKRF